MFDRGGGDSAAILWSVLRFQIASDFLAISDRCDCDFAIWASKTKTHGLVFYLQLGPLYLRLVFVACGNLVRSFLLTVDNWFGLFYLRFPPSGN